MLWGICQIHLPFLYFLYHIAEYSVNIFGLSIALKSFLFAIHTSAGSWLSGHKRHRSDDGQLPIFHCPL